jgi:NAD(P)-dependent dehydrogenase (short-subunit alcohol dehydrogenase family)
MAHQSLQGKTLFITGGASGIGAETARQAAKRGARLALVDIDGEAAERVASSLPDAIGIQADVRDYDAIVAAVEKTVERFGGIDIAMANAGIEYAGTARGLPVEDIERIADINFTGVLRTAKAVLPHLLDSRGYLLITASLAAVLHSPPISHYVATKAGVEAFGDAIRSELAHKGVDVGVAYFGFIDTPMVARGKADPILAEFEARNGQNPLGKTYPLSGAVAAVIRGLEGRTRRVIYPRWIRGFMVLRSLMPRAIDRVLAQRDIGELVDALDARDIDHSVPPAPPEAVNPVEKADAERLLS